VSDQLKAPAALSPEEEPRYTLDRRLSEPQSRSGRHGEEKIIDPTGTRTPTRRSSKLYIRLYIFFSRKRRKNGTLEKTTHYEDIYKQIVVEIIILHGTPSTAIHITAGLEAA
jgi:hypothetical protein